MIVVLGCPVAGRAALKGDTLIPAGLAFEISRAAVAAGASVELVGSLGDDAAGDAMVVGLTQERIGHAALLRAPGVMTAVVGTPGARSPELGQADVELGLSYFVDYRVLVLSEPLAAPAAGAAMAAARYQSAHVVAIVTPGETVDPSIASVATVLEAPAGETGPFARMVGRFAAALDAGAPAGTAFARATEATGWTAAG